MKDQSEFYVGYSGKIGRNTRRSIVIFLSTLGFMIMVFGMLFSLSQLPFANSTFELFNETKVTGIFHQNPYPMLKVEVAPNTYKNILLLGFGKMSVNTYLRKILKEENDLTGKEISIEGNLIYYDGKALLQVTDENKILLTGMESEKKIPKKVNTGEGTFQGEIVDPKCYFGVMKPGYGKIHRSCAVLCVSGGIPPVLVVKSNDSSNRYLLLTDLNGKAINNKILSHIGKPVEISGELEKMENWDLLKVNVSQIVELNLTSSIY